MISSGTPFLEAIRTIRAVTEVEKDEPEFPITTSAGFGADDDGVSKCWTSGRWAVGVYGYRGEHPTCRGRIRFSGPDF